MSEQTASGVLREIRRYPVKSMMGESLREAAVGESGLPGDRCWAVRDEVRGGIRGAKRIPGLMALRARFPEEPKATGSSAAEITFEDGSTGGTGDADIAERISAAVGHEVTLWPLLPPDRLDHYRRGPAEHDDLEKELRSVFAREPGEPLPDVSAFPPEVLEYESPPGTYFDAFPILLVTTRSLATMEERAPESRFDVRRFRPNFVVELDGADSAADAGGDEGFPELGWGGKALRLGDAVLRAELGCPRCVMVTHGFDDLPKDPKVMRALVRETGGELGVYASVAKPGRVRVGDRLEVL